MCIHGSHLIIKLRKGKADLFMKLNKNQSRTLQNCISDQFGCSKQEQMN